MPKCLAFKHGLTIGPSGAVRPCCAFRTENISSMPLHSDWKSRHDQWDQDSQTVWLPQCLECEQDERLNGKSLRMYYNQVLEHAVGIQYWDLKINNTCNLSCRMCHPTSSSQWQQNLDRNPHSAFDRYYQVSLTSRWHRESQDLVPLMLDAKVVKFTGGEPMLIPQVKSIIQQLIQQDIAPAVTLELITNGTYDLLAWQKYFDKFARVNINISVDAIGKRYEYIRPGASWQQVSDNIKRFASAKSHNVYLSINCLPMVLNKDHISEVQQWCLENNLHFSLASPIISPDFLRTDALSDPELAKKFCQQMSIQDQIHGTDYREFIDEQEITQ